MKHILERREWIQLNEAFFSEGSAYSKHKEKAMSIMDKLVKEKGFSIKLAAALAGNMFKESGFNPAIESPGGTYVGLIQWGGGRKAKLKAKSNWKTVDTQLNFIEEELNGAYSKIKTEIENAPTIEKAAELVGKKYEVCADPTSEKRIKGAKEIFDMYSEEFLDKETQFPGPDYSADSNLEEPTVKP